jgi:hypothetical protein
MPTEGLVQGQLGSQACLSESHASTTLIPADSPLFGGALSFAAMKVHNVASSNAATWM